MGGEDAFSGKRYDYPISLTVQPAGAAGTADEHRLLRNTVLLSRSAIFPKSPARDPLMQEKYLGVIFKLSVTRPGEKT